MLAVLQPASVPGEFLERVTNWAREQPTPVSVILFGSRARGDHGPDSDWDIALVYEGAPPSLDGLPRSIDDHDVDWSPMERSRAIRQLNVCGVPHAAAADGFCLHGAPLPMPEWNEVNIAAAWDSLHEAHREVRHGIRALADYWTDPPRLRWGYDTAVARQSAMAGELLCKAALSMRGVEPQRSHSVEELCNDLEDACPADPLLPLLRECDGGTAQAHVNVYANLSFPREAVGESSRRLASVLRASGQVVAAACDGSFAEKSRVKLEAVTARREAFRRETRELRSSDCTRDILRRIEDGAEAGPNTSELWDRLMAVPLGRTTDREGRRDASGGR